jgi:O-antigen chain-terminating methyltransferase
MPFEENILGYKSNMNLKSGNMAQGIGDTERYVEIPWALSEYSDEQTVLDIGYANAEERYITSLLSLKIPCLHGLDLSEKKIEGFISHIGDIRQTNFEDNFFDLIFCISTIEHVGRDNSKYIQDYFEDVENGDLEALKEIYRITKNNGKCIITVPFGRFVNYGWFIQYDEKRLNILLQSAPFGIVKMEFFIYENGWHSCDKEDLKNIVYKDNNAPAAAGLVCLLLKKISDNPLSIQKRNNNKYNRKMTENPVEIPDDDINVEEIMRKLRENIRRRHACEELYNNPDSKIGPDLINEARPSSYESIRQDLDFIDSNWEIHNNSYTITSHHHPAIGKVLVKGRQLVQGEVRRYIDPVVTRQTRFNASIARILNQTTQKSIEIENEFSQFKTDFDHKIHADIDSVKNELERENEMRIVELDKKNETLTRELFAQLDADITTRSSLAHVLEERINKALSEMNTEKETISSNDTNYFLFEERFRGSREDIKKRQLSFLPYFEKCTNVLDIGCGRGEFLEILRDNNIPGTGIDLDADMITYCRSRQLSVEQTDAINYLEHLEDKSVDGIFIDQVVEHLEPEYLFRLLALCYQKLKFGYYIVIETVNPQSFVSFVNFYIDLTHKRPLHPQTLQFLVSAAGFRENDKKFFSPVSDDSRLKMITDTSEMDAPSRKNAEVYNHNIEMLNSILFGPQDYAVIAKK